MPDVKYGLSATGFKRKRLPEILQSINARISDTLGLKTQIQSNSVLGQIVGVFAYEIADLCYHVMVLMVEMGISVEDIHRELASRHVIDHKVKQEKMTK